MRRKSLFSVISKAISSSLKKESPKSQKEHQPALNLDQIKSKIFNYGKQGNIAALTLLDKYKQYYKPTDLHFLYNELQSQYYKKRETSPIFLEKTIEVCEMDLELLLIALLPLAQEARLPCVERLITIYEKKKDYKKAIEICQKAVDNFFNGDYYRKLQKLNYKLYPETKPKNKVEKVIDVNVLAENEKVLIEAVNNELNVRGYKNSTYQLYPNGELRIWLWSNVLPTFNIYYDINLRHNSNEYFLFVLGSKIPSWVNSIENQDKIFSKWNKH